MANLSILLIDDDVELGALMKEYFSAKGITLACAYSGEAGLNQALETGFDLVLLDVMLPHLDGFSVLEGLRRRSSVPVIMLTSRTEQQARIQGLNAGADDYLPKPFSPDELLARIQAVLRRAGRTPALKPEVLEANSVRINPASREVFYEGTPVEVTSIEFDILEVLMRSAGRVVSRDDLAKFLYNRQANPLERALDVHVSHLRKKLDRDRNLIRTVRGVGYLFSPGDVYSIDPDQA
ncbi:MAG TPA: response regulator transcription factor [Bryobacteraceae bacterium]|nr:response regulator transcription factor [Bryobacteraceae bacterium]